MDIVARGVMIVSDRLGLSPALKSFP